jgi:hypothetical protein
MMREQGWLLEAELQEGMSVSEREIFGPNADNNNNTKY